MSTEEKVVDGVPNPLFRLLTRMGLAEHRSLIEKARQVLGYEPRVGFEEGLSRTIRWYRREGLLA